MTLSWLDLPFLLWKESGHLLERGSAFVEEILYADGFW